MVRGLVVTRLMPVTASVAIHVALVGGTALLPAWTAPQESVVILELVEPETRPAPMAPPPKRDPRPLVPPKPIVAPMPAPPQVEKPIEKPVEPPPAPRVETPPPEPVKTTAAVPPPAPLAAATPPAAATPAPTAQPPSAAAPSPPGGAATFTAGDAPSTRELVAPRDPAVAALPPSDGVTQGAVPRPGYHPQPPYPRSARDKRIEGTTLLRVFVAANGRVGEVIVRESAGDPALDEAAASTIRKWLFEPARRGREAVAVWVELPVVFTIKR